MAGDSVIGALRVVLGADTASLDKGLKSSQSKVAAFGASIKSSLEIAAAGVATAVAALGYSMKHTIDQADELSKLSQKIGVPVEELSGLAHAADLSGVSIESLGKGVAKLAKNMADAAAKPLGEAANAFRAVGVSVVGADGNLRATSDVMADVAGKFENMKDGAGKTAVAMAIFGKAGADLIPMLNSGKVGLAAMIVEARELGITIDTKTARSAEAFNDNLTRLGRVWNGLVVKVTAALLPALQQFSQVMIDAAKNSNFVSIAASAIVTGLKGAVDVVLSTVLAFQRLGAELSALSNVFTSFGNWDQMKAAWAGFRNEEQKTAESFANLSEFTKKFWTDAAAGAEASAPKVQKGLTDINVAALGGKNALEQFIDSQKKSIASTIAQAQTVGLSAGEQAKLKVELEAQAIATAKLIPLNDALRQKITDTANAAATAAMTLQAAQLTQQAMSPAEVFDQKMAQQKQLLDQGLISLDTYGKAQQMIAEQASATWDLAGASMAGSFAQIAGAFGKESKGMATAAKVFGIIQGTISMFTGAAKALELPFPANIAAVAAVLAKGASLVASIKSQTVPSGFMTGGSMMVRGSGGPDSVPVSLMASPGEQIDVWRPEQGGGSDPRRRGGGGTFNVAVPNIPIGREALRSLFEQINEIAGDGFTLKVAAA